LHEPHRLCWHDRWLRKHALVGGLGDAEHRNDLAGAGDLYVGD